MVTPTPDSDHTKTLTPEQIRDARNAWAMGVPLAIVARQYAIDESHLGRHLGLPADVPIGPTHVDQMRERRRQLEALRKRFGGGQ